MGIIATVRKVHIVRKIENLPVHQIAEAKVYKDKQTPKQQNCTTVWHIILIMLFSRSPLFSSVPMLGFGWEFGAVLYGFFSIQEKIPLPGKLAGCICFNPMYSAVRAGQESRFQFHLLCPLHVLYI